MREMIQKMRRFMSNRFSEVLITACCAIAVSVFGYGIKAQVTLQERVTENKVCIARNEEAIKNTATASNLSDTAIIERISQLREFDRLSEESLTRMIHDLKERLDQRCDTLENLLSLDRKAKDTGD